MKPKTNSSPLYTEGRLRRNEIAFASMDVGVTIASLTSAHKAALLGQTIAHDGGVYMTQEDEAPFVALLYKAPIVGGYRYGVLYKGQFGPYDEELAQKEGKTTYGVPVLAATYQPTIYATEKGQHLIEYHVDTTDPGCPANIADTWFEAVTIPAADKTAPTVEVVPMDGATEVAVTDSVVWTFSKAIDPTNATNANFMLIEATTGEMVDGSLSIDSTGKNVTFDPKENLAASTAYIAVATTNICDLAGNNLVATSTTNFTTAS